MKIGILGGGQLARMLSLAGTPLGVDFVFLCQAHDACAATVGEHLHARFDDKEALQTLASQVDLLTYEFESVPAQSVEILSKQLPVYPPPQALATARDRLHEKMLFNELGIKTAEFVNLTSFKDLQQAVAKVGLPAIIKTRTEGYDGKGQQFLRQEPELAAAWKAMNDAPAIIEAFVPFDREVSIIAARSVSGELAFYPLTENEHRDGILHKSTALANDPMQGLAESYAERLLKHLDYVGVLAIEFFQVGDKLLVNEMAPRVHNSGHWTIEGAETSQFENHIRAILDWPLGSTALLGHTVMLNLIGDLPDSKNILAQPHAHLHLYGKDERPGRKVGHITICAEDEATVNATIEAIGPV